MALIKLFQGEGIGFVASAEAFDRINPKIDQSSYTAFLEQARQIARVEPGADDKNLVIAEKLTETSMSDQQALNIVMSALERHAA